jgi:murein DD-endopeptidase MepM/ murein hydrolase activator NlpD
MGPLRCLCVAVTASLLLASAWSAPPARAAVDPVGVWPLQPRPELIEGFAPPDDPWGSGHRGVDLLGTPGQAVHAAVEGWVTYAGMIAGRGVVVVSHGETRTTYEPVVASVPVGTFVERGQQVGSLAGTGSHCLPRSCLHWGWLRATTYLNPLDLIGSGSVRLLPLWRSEPAGVSVRRAVPSAVLPYEPWLLPYAVILSRLFALTGRSPPTSR